MIDGVVSARVVPALGERRRPGLSLVARPDRPLAALLHDVCSVLRDRFDLDLDPDQMQVAVVTPESGPAPAGPRWRLVSISQRSTGRWVDVAVQLTQGDRLCTGYVRVRGRARQARRRAAALAVIDAVATLLGVDLALELVGIEEIQFSDRSAVAVALALNDARRTERFTGLAERVGQHDDECVARATLDALNRRLRLVALGTRQRRGKEVVSDLEVALAPAERARLAVIDGSGGSPRGGNGRASRRRRWGAKPHAPLARAMCAWWNRGDPVLHRPTGR